jgi:hypothetical protein
MNKIVFAKILLDALSGAKLFRLFCWTSNNYMIGLQRSIGTSLVAFLRFTWMFRVFIFLKEILGSAVDHRIFSGYIFVTIGFYLHLLLNLESWLDKFIIAQIFLNGLMVILRPGRLHVTHKQKREIELFNSQISKIFPKKKVSTCESCDSPVLLRVVHCPICSCLIRGLHPRQEHALFGAEHLHQFPEQFALHDVPLVGFFTGL